MPVGFAYLEARPRDGLAISDPVGAGPAARLLPGTLNGSTTGVLTYRVEVGPGATLGDGTNRAVATSALGQATSNPTASRVRVLGGPFADEGTIAGKVFFDCDCHPDSVQGPEEVGVPGVRVALEDGTAAITDVEGKYHFVGVSPRLHVVRIDRNTLPAETHSVALTNRHAEDGWSQFVDLKKGELFRADFAVRSSPELKAEVLARRTRGEVGDPIWVDPALGAATVTGPAVNGVRTTTAYRGMLEEHG